MSQPAVQVIKQQPVRLSLLEAKTYEGISWFI